MCNIPLKDIKLARQTLCLSILFLGSVWRASNSISFLTLHLCPNKFLNANSYNAGTEETKYKTRYKNAKHPCYWNQMRNISNLIWDCNAV
jgi:hypothetical protein